MAAAPLRALLAHSIDYAGLFPPANLALATALENHGDHIRDPEAWMLGGFILPLTKFEDVSAHLAKFDVDHPLRICALGPKTESPSAFRTALDTAAETIRDFRLRHGAITTIAQLEMALPVQPGATALDASQILSVLQGPIFWEAPADDAERSIQLLADLRSEGRGNFGFKLRTGGIIASAFPSSVQIARALVAAVAHRVPIKFTAGLHHPIRQFRASVQTRMHGFLNVLGAGVLAAEHGWDVQKTAAMLDDEDASAFTFDDSSFAWRESNVSTQRIEEHRKLITSLGSCSFDEPRADLRALGFG